MSKTILATTYAVNPYKGSEDGMGWNFVCQIARFNKVYAVTRENNKDNIEKFMKENPNDLYENIHFLYYDLPYWMRFWKKGGRGAMLYYWMWQYGIVSFIKRQSIDFDIAHNVNFHNDWTPSYLWKLKKPFVWGPVGHHPLIPKQYLEGYDKKYYLKDRLTWLVKLFFWNINLSLKKTTRKAHHVICMNKSAVDVLKLKKNYSVTPSVATEDFGSGVGMVKDYFTIISAGRLVPLKGFDLTINAFADFYNGLNLGDKAKVSLKIVGSGPELNYLKQIATDKNILERITFIDWIERKDLLELYKKSSLFLFPSHEGAGMVVAEAMSFSLPVICLNNSGPGEFIDNHSGIAIQEASYSETVSKLSHAISDVFHSKSDATPEGARKRYEEFFKWDVRGEQLKRIYSELV